jgi:hypothetical protein
MREKCASIYVSGGDAHCRAAASSGRPLLALFGLSLACTLTFGAQSTDEIVSLLEANKWCGVRFYIPFGALETNRDYICQYKGDVSESVGSWHCRGWHHGKNSNYEATENGPLLRQHSLNIWGGANFDYRGDGFIYESGRRVGTIACGDLRTVPNYPQNAGGHPNYPQSNTQSQTAPTHSTPCSPGETWNAQMQQCQKQVNVPMPCMAGSVWNGSQCVQFGH